MPKYIDADKIPYVQSEDGCLDDYAFRYDINEIPAADVVEVVRCKDCRFCKKHPTSDKTKMCTNEQQWVTDCYPLVHDTDFCSYGERKEATP